VGIFDIFDIEHPKDVVAVPEASRKKPKDKHLAGKRSNPSPSASKESYLFQFPLILEGDGTQMIFYPFSFF
jgi:hypothetical protein